MKLRAAIAGITLFAVASCTPPRAEQVKTLRDELVRHFSNLNRDAEMRKIDLKTPRGGLDGQVSSGRQYSDFLWHPEQIIVIGVEAVPVALKGKDQFESLERKHGAKKVIAMFDASGEAATKGMAKVRVQYLRRHWVYDPRGQVPPGKGPELGELLSAAPYSAESFVDVDGRPTAPSLVKDSDFRPTQSNYYYGGFHRLEMTYLGELEVEYAGGMKIVSESEAPLQYASAPAVPEKAEPK